MRTIGNRKTDRILGNGAFETLVSEGLLLNDYFILTSTNRPIRCYAKVLPKDDIDRKKISDKLIAYNIQLSHYIELSQSTGLTSNFKLNSTGHNLFSQTPYSNIYHIITNCSNRSTSSTEQSPSASSSTVRSATTTNIHVPTLPERRNNIFFNQFVRQPVLSTTRVRILNTQRSDHVHINLRNSNIRLKYLTCLQISKKFHFRLS